MMNYNFGKGHLENWVVAEDSFDPKHLGKCEAIMYLGNGYMGVRSAAEEFYFGETRNTFISGTFNKFDEYEVTELPNAADVTSLDITVDGERFNLQFGHVEEYIRTLNLQTAELQRSFIWTSPKGKKISFKFRRFVSLNNLHLVGMHLEMKSLTDDVNVQINSGINAQMSNSGSQHFHEGERRIFDKKYVQLIQTTTQSKLDFVINTVHNVHVGAKKAIEPTMDMDRRKVWLTYSATLAKDETLSFEKLSNYHTSRDLEHEDKDLEALRMASLEDLKAAHLQGYETLLSEHVAAWQQKVWSQYPFEIDSKNSYDLLAIRFAIYHLTIMTPAHDSRMGVGAKALSGEGYKGHSFWDTELFILPFFTYSNPKVARSLLEYRYKGLVGARKKAKENGYEGAMYPWEAAWPTDGEVTPVWGGVDVVTGKQTKIWSGFIEQHITSDIAYAVWQYYMITNDEEFMDNYGYEILFDTARFWITRLEWNEEKQEYHINNVIGPDEYKEHVNNNAFTNYAAHQNIRLAMEYYEVVKNEKPEIFERLNKELDLETSMKLWTERAPKIYLPKPNEDQIIPQDDTYLQKKIIDLTKYKNQTKVGSMFREYSLDQVNEMQVSKQADIMILFYLLENLFSKEVKLANYNYYEPKTLHDSSLSLSTHCILANDLADSELAYDLFRRATEIDLGPNMGTSDHGVHAASIGGIWQCVVMGFAGVRMLGGELRIQPRLPEAWNRLAFNIHWKQQLLQVVVTKDEVSITVDGDEEVTVTICDELHKFTKSTTISY